MFLRPACRWTHLPRRGLSPCVTTLGHTHVAVFTCCRWRGVCRNAFALQLPPGSTVPFIKPQVDPSVCILMFLQPYFHLCMRCCLKDGEKSFSSRAGHLQAEKTIAPEVCRGDRPHSPAGGSGEEKHVHSAFTLPSLPPPSMEKGTLVSHLKAHSPQRSVPSVLPPCLCRGVEPNSFFT